MQGFLLMVFKVSCHLFIPLMKSGTPLLFAWGFFVLIKGSLVLPGSKIFQEGLLLAGVKDGG